MQLSRRGTDPWPAAHFLARHPCPHPPHPAPRPPPHPLLQMTCGFSRDDAEAKFLPLYVREGILPADPFEVGPHPAMHRAPAAAAGH